MKLAMIGLGKLGLPVAEVMSSKHQVKGFDVRKVESAEIEVSPTLSECVQGCEFIFVAVETPHDSAYGGESPTSHLPTKDFDYSTVKSVLRDLNPHLDESQTVVLISTVLPGTTRSQLASLLDRAELIYNPYLIAMSTVKQDMVRPEMVIIGTETATETSNLIRLLEFYEEISIGPVRIEKGTWEEAEAIKIFYNTFISAKISLVNMIHDVAEEIGKLNVDVVTQALANSSQRIMSRAYMKAGMGDGGPCHPRDNIALSWLAENLELGYDLFGAISVSREVQAKRLAKKVKSFGSQVLIVGKAYKPGVHLESGSYSLLVGHYLQELGAEVQFYDPNTGDTDLPNWSAEQTVYLIGYIEGWVREFNFKKGSTVVDPWRQLSGLKESCRYVAYGDTRKAQQGSKATDTFLLNQDLHQQ